MLLFTLLAALLLSPAESVLSIKPSANMPRLDPLQAQAGCPETPMSLARKRADRPILRRLDKLPNAQAFAAVDRRVNRCPAPMLLGERVGR
jgi:hypothetical protein